MHNYQEITKFLVTKGKELFGNHFKIYKEDESIIEKLIAYMVRDEKKAIELNISLEKGILLSGPIGCGKTSLMTLIKHITEKEKYYVKSCRDVSFEFIQDGYEVVHRYSKGKLYQPKYNTICFDDLGTESNLKYFGNECNVMAEIILSRYDLFISKKLKTHITTNLSASEIEQQYGNRVRSRMRELFNLIAYDNTSIDKRR